MKKKLLILQFVLAVVVYSSAQTHLPAILACNEKLTLAGSPYIVDNTITIKKGCQLTVDPGVEIRVAENMHLIVRGKVDFLGTALKPIFIHAIDTVWGNIFLDSTLTQKSTFNYVNIENTTESVGGDQEPAAIYGLYSSLEVKNCHFKNNLRCISIYQCPNTLFKDCILDSTNIGEKIHGQYCDNSIIDGCILYFTSGDRDAIDFDASKNIVLSNNYIYGGEDDGIDIGQCDSIGCNRVTIEGNYIFNMKNKGISNGERCLNININHNLIIGCAMGIGAKSGAVVVADHNTLFANRLGVNSYDHLDQIWGPGNLTVTNSIIANSDSTYWVDPTAFLSVSYSLADDTLIPGTGNIIGDPRFVSATNFHLTSGSLAIDKGDPSFAKDPNGSRTDIGKFYFGDPTSIQSNRGLEIESVYPNPNKGKFTLNLIPNYEMNHLVIQNILGQIVEEENFFGNKTEHLVVFTPQIQGVYYLRLTSKNSIATKRIIIY
ncbi:MAG: right-handed parallel beta-helix repeat-containing protein [Bacteroidetes bacterium]|nr:right-handed parallel beta-helix repeat-containing protein [Bacteroidota bacterium]